MTGTTLAERVSYLIMTGDVDQAVQLVAMRVAYSISEGYTEDHVTADHEAILMRLTPSERRAALPRLRPHLSQRNCGRLFGVTRGTISTDEIQMNWTPGHADLVETDDDWMPNVKDHSQRAAARRIAIIGEMAATGSTSRQISEAIGISDSRVRENARKHDIVIPADAVVRKSRWARDSNHMLQVIVDDLDASLPSLEMIKLEELDPARVSDWVKAIRGAARELNAFARKLGEVS